MRTVRVGGQALPDGVLMRTERAWAIARHDGSVSSGDLPPPRFAGVPVVRVLTGLGPVLLLGLRGGRGDRKATRPLPWSLLRGLAVAQGVAFGADWLGGLMHLGRQWSPEFALIVLILAIGSFRLVTPEVQWRLHGAEHKAVTAYEQGIDLQDIPVVLGCSRVHPRCGTNIVVWAALAVMWFGDLPWPLQLVASILAIAVAAEVMSVASRYQDNVVAKGLQAPGALLQRFMTTSEPTPAEQIVGCRALVVCLQRHEVNTTSRS